MIGRRGYGIPFIDGRKEEGMGRWEERRRGGWDRYIPFIDERE